MNTSKTLDNELEYKFSEEQMNDEVAVAASSAQASLSAPTVEKPKSSGLFARKKLVIALVAVVTVGAVFQFMQKRDHSAEQAVQNESEAVARAQVLQRKQEATPVVEQNHQKPAVKAPVSETKASPIEVTAQKPVTLMDQAVLGDKVKVQEGNPTAVKQMQQGLSEVNHSIDSLQKTVVSLSASVETLSNQVQKLTAEQAAAKAQPIPAQTYHLKSLITGRAWIEDTEGELLTVKVGDIVPGYGKVTGIDPEGGLVTTASGTNITYGPNDS